MRTIIRFFSGWKLTTCGDCRRGWRPGGLREERNENDALSG